MKAINFGLKLIAGAGILFLLMIGALSKLFKHSAGPDYMLNFNPITGRVCATDTALKISSVEISTNSDYKLVLRLKDSLPGKPCVNIYDSVDSNYYYSRNQFANDTQHTFQLSVAAKGPSDYRLVEFRHVISRTSKEVVNIKNENRPW